MHGDLILAIFSIALGFVGAGVLSSIYQLITAEPARFDIYGETLAKGIVMTFMVMFAGPAILMRNAIRGRMIERRPVGWLFASTAIAGAWSLCLGVVMLPFLVALSRTLN